MIICFFSPLIDYKIIIFVPYTYFYLLFFLINPYNYFCYQLGTSQNIKGRNDVDFIIQMIQYDSETQQKTDKQQIEISDEVENLLTN